MAIDTIILSEPKFENYLRQFSTTNWILNVGAGVCVGILPNWFELTLGLVNTIFKKKWDKIEFKNISDEIGFSLDSWIQGCYNELIAQGKTVDDFNKSLEFVLYQELLEKADIYGVKESLILLFESPKTIKRKKLLKLYDFFESNYSSSTLIQIVKALVYADNKAKLPSAIITFNADSLLHSLILLYSIKQRFDDTGEYAIPKEQFRKVTRTFQSWGDNIPILSPLRKVED